MSRQEEAQQLNEIKNKLYRLSRWKLFLVYLFIQWLRFLQVLRNIAGNWVLFQLEVNERLKILLRLSEL